MPSTPIYIHSSTIRNPCPDGTSIGYGEWNGTIFLICDAAFNHATEEANALAIGLGVGLGLGIPCLLALSCCLGKYFYANNTTLPMTAPKDNPAPFLDTQMIVKELTEKAYADFCFDNLTDELKRELMILRIKKGRNLTEFVKLARLRNAMEVANWIDRMNPGEFPKEIHQEANRPIQAEAV